MRFLTIPFVLASALAAQEDRVVVVTRAAPPALTSLLDVDLATGATRALGRFGLDSFPPLAVAVDAVNRDVVVVLQTPAATSVLVRLRVAGTSLVQLGSLGDVPGTVNALAQALGGKWIALTDAGVYVTERNGSVARLVVGLPGASATDTFGYSSSQALVAQSGDATRDPSLRWLDLTNGNTIAGPWVYAGHQPRGITGVGDLPTGLSRQVIGQADGTVAMSLNFANPVPLPLQPLLPAGATTAVRLRGLDGVALGNSAHPFLKAFNALNGTQWTQLAGPLPGDPVDFAFRPAVVAATVAFGTPCGRMQLRADTANGPPRIGNTQYQLELTGAMPFMAAFLMLGASDQSYLSLRLPLLLPGGCLALVGAHVVLLGMVDGFGRARFAAGIPSNPALLGGIVFAQGIQVPAAIDTSDAVAIWIGQ